MRKRERHGESKTKLFNVWASMRYRCLPRWKDRKNYFDRGISVCGEWDRFSVFKEWAYSNGYVEGLDIDRKDNDSGYRPDNCRFVARIINTSNRRNTVMVDYNGRKISLTILKMELGLSMETYNRIRRRLKSGWDFMKAMEEPPRSTGYTIGKVEVVDVDSGITYDSIKDAALSNGISKNHLSAMLKGSRTNHTKMRYKS